MHIKSIFLSILSLILCSTLNAQELYIPRNIQQAYKNNTRSMTGRPGSNYWQNRSTYNIRIKVSPPDRTVHGIETINYTNHSPDTLHRINFKLINNIHKPGAVRAWRAPQDFIASGIHIDKFTINGKPHQWKSKNDGTSKFIRLKKPLFPGKTLRFHIEWHYELAERDGREGVIKDHTFYLAYFYPRVAVYDDYNGWDRLPHLGSQEFYNDFNDYTFEVTVPNGYIVWATGILLNPDAVLREKYADRLERSMNSDEVIHIVTSKDLRKHNITQQNKTNTWQWVATNVTDIAIAVSNEYLWDASSVVLDSLTGRRVSVQAAYDSVSTDFEEMVNYASNAIQWFSSHSPGVPYPYPKMTVVRGHANMEYPMMVNDDSHPDNPDFTRFVVEHEIAHTYFPFFMGINETRFGFMDEGWATTFEYLIGIADIGKKQAGVNYKRFRVYEWAHDPTIAADLPIIIPASILRGNAMGYNEYGKASLGYLALRDMLGEEAFANALHEYMKRWNGKHPMPWDFFFTFNDVTGKNLNWFWNSWFFQFNHIDIAIQEVDPGWGNVKITLKNIGGLPAPVDIVVVDKNNKEKVYHQSPAIWKGNKGQVTIKLEDVRGVQKIYLKGGIWVDSDISNNVWVRE